MTRQTKSGASIPSEMGANQGFPDSWECIDCGVDTHPGNLKKDERGKYIAGDMWFGPDSEVYAVRDFAWRKAGNPEGCLCIGCLEKRIGRRLKPKDFPRDEPLNMLPGSDRLESRRGW